VNRARELAFFVIRFVRVGSGQKQAQLIAMLRRKEGATIAQIVTATRWKPHTVRGAFAGALTGC